MTEVTEGAVLIRESTRAFPCSRHIKCDDRWLPLGVLDSKAVQSESLPGTQVQTRVFQQEKREPVDRGEGDQEDSKFISTQRTEKLKAVRGKEVDSVTSETSPRTHPIRVCSCSS